MGYREDQEKKKEEMKKKRIEDRAKEAERKKEEKRLVKELIEEWSSRREDLDCDDLKALPVPTPVRSRIPNQLTGDVFSLLEFINSFLSWTRSNLSRVGESTDRNGNLRGRF